MNPEKEGKKKKKMLQKKVNEMIKCYQINQNIITLRLIEIDGFFEEFSLKYVDMLIS